MPSKSQAQHNYMEGIAHGDIKPGKHGPSKKVAEEFVKHDKGKSIKDLPKHAKKKK